MRDADDKPQLAHSPTPPTRPLRVTGLFHAMLVAWDIERAERFYREVLGIGRHATPSYFPGDVVFLDVGNAMIHLVRVGRAAPRAGSADAPALGQSPPPSPATRDGEGGGRGEGEVFPDEAAFIARQRQRDPTRTHFALDVDDLDAALARVRDAGRPIVLGPLTRPDGMRCFFFADTEYNVVELVQH